MWEPTLNDIEEIKLINGEQNAEKDEYYRTMLPFLLEHIQQYCNNSFGDPITIPGGVKIFMAKAIQHNQNKAGLKSRTMGTVTYTYDAEFPASFYDYLRPYKRVRFHASR